uniref:Uncharacterized protein LOC114344173 n=1 Tax=Diabrotica virgifera virgifera TaxID=50390 RepID=A0A6P7H494_DIAVI
MDGRKRLSGSQYRKRRAEKEIERKRLKTFLGKFLKLLHTDADNITQPREHVAATALFESDNIYPDLGLSSASTSAAALSQSKDSHLGLSSASTFAAAPSQFNDSHLELSSASTSEAVWLQKLIGEPCEGVQKKRCRNIYLSNLLVGMQNGLLEKPFMAPARDTDILNAHEVFGPIPDTVELPSWLNDTELDTTRIHTSEGKGKRGRTYVATRTLPNGQGAFAYVGISLTNEEPMWLGAGER